jgi:hypothetical protein
VLSTRQPSRNGKGYAWWNADCTATAQSFCNNPHHAQAAAAGLPASREWQAAIEAKQKLKCCVGQAKKRFFADEIDAAIIDKTIYRMTKWALSSGRFKSPSLTKPNSSKAVTNADKINTP